VPLEGVALIEHIPSGIGVGLGVGIDVGVEVGVFDGLFCLVVGVGVEVETTFTVGVVVFLGVEVGGSD